jgi:hypothetical protein
VIWSLNFCLFYEASVVCPPHLTKKISYARKKCSTETDDKTFPEIFWHKLKRNFAEQIPIIETIFNCFSLQY